MHGATALPASPACLPSCCLLRSQSQGVGRAAGLSLLATNPLLSLSASSLPSTFPQPLSVRECLSNWPVVTHLFLPSWLPSLPIYLSVSLSSRLREQLPPHFDSRPSREAVISSSGQGGVQTQTQNVRARSQAQPSTPGLGPELQREQRQDLWPDESFLSLFLTFE